MKVRTCVKGSVVLWLFGPGLLNDFLELNLYIQLNQVIKLFWDSDGPRVPQRAEHIGMEQNVPYKVSWALPSQIM